MIIVNLDVQLAKKKMKLGELADIIGITNANLSILKTGKAKAIRFHFFPTGMPENIRILGVEPDEDQNDIINNAIAALQEFPENHNVLIMTNI